MIEAAEGSWNLQSECKKLLSESNLILEISKQGLSAVVLESPEMILASEPASDLVRQNGWLQPGVVLDAVSNNHFLVLEAARQDGFALLCALESLRGDRKVVLEAVNQNGWALEFASEELSWDREVVLAAVRQNGQALEFVPEALRGDREIVREAVKQNRWALRHASAELRQDNPESEGDEQLSMQRTPYENQLAQEEVILRGPRWSPMCHQASLGVRRSSPRLSSRGGPLFTPKGMPSLPRDLLLHVRQQTDALATCEDPNITQDHDLGPDF
jgi:hypothetical protein